MKLHLRATECHLQCCCQGLETQGQEQGQGLDVQGRGQGRGLEL